jgi:hypothetical protein
MKKPNNYPMASESGTKTSQISAQCVLVEKLVKDFPS